MKTAKQIIDEINQASLWSVHHVKYDLDLDGSQELVTINRDEHRWYTIGTVVYRAPDGLLFGVDGPCHLNSESMGYRDLEIKCTAFEMEEVPSVTYKRKLNNE